MCVLWRLVVDAPKPEDIGEACEYREFPLGCSPGLLRAWASIGGNVMLLVLCEDVNDQFPESRGSDVGAEPLIPARFPMGGRV